MKTFAKLFAILGLLLSLHAQADTATVGVVLMHGKGGSPGKFVNELASSLQGRGLQVANLEMPWSGRRGYDASVAAAEAEVEAAFTAMRDKGASKLFIAGHSQGGIFALYFAGKHRVDGAIAIAPGGNVGSPIFLEKLGSALALARQNVQDGKGAEKIQLSDFEGSKGVYPVLTTANNYLTWFEPDGAMNQVIALKSIQAQTPVLYIAPSNDYPALVRTNGQMYDLLAKHPLTRLYAPACTHLNAPTASAATIAEWISSVAEGK